MSPFHLAFTPIILHIIISLMSGKCSSYLWKALTDNCTCARTGHPTYSLFSLAGKRIEGSGFPPHKGYTYTFMPCVPDNMHSTQGNCTNVALCKYNTDGDQPVYSDIGEQRNVMCETSDDYKFVLIYPIANPDIPTHQSKVIIVCNDSLPGPELNLISEKEMIFSLSTRCGCANQCSPPKPTTAPVPASIHNVPTTPSTPGDSKSNWELTILLPSVLVLVIVFCSLCLWWKRAAIREALRFRCRLCCDGYNDLGVEEERNDLGVEEERQECVTETTALLKNQQNNQAVEHEDPGGKGKLKEPVQVEEGDVGEEYTSIGKDNKTAIV